MHARTVLDAIVFVARAEGLSLAKLAARSRMDETRVLRIVRGVRTPQPVELEALAGVLRSTPEAVVRAAAEVRSVLDRMQVRR